MRKFVLTWVTMLVALWVTPARADLVLSGEVGTFSGAGTYSLSIFATAVGSAHEINGSNIALDFSDVGGSPPPGPTYAPNPVLELASPVVNLGANQWGVGGTDTSFPTPAGMVLNDGQTAELGTLTFDATQAGTVSFVPFATFQFEGGAPIATSFVQGPTLQAIPEPSSLAGIAVCGVSALVRRRRNG